MEERKGLVASRGNPVTLVGNPVKLGAPAPAFVALRSDFSAFSLKDAAGKVVIINAVPSLDTAVCAMQARHFNRDAAELGDGVKVVVVSMDLPFAQKRFCATEGIQNLETLSDHRDASFGRGYGLLVKETRLLARAVLVVDRDGTVRYEQIVSEIGKEPDYEAALAAARSML